jgi:hypothetical protein
VAYNCKILTLNEKRVRSEIIRKINYGDLKWNYKFIIITELWECDGFTSLISMVDNAQTNLISLEKDFSKIECDIANPNLKIKILDFNKIFHKSIAMTDTTPYFKACRFTHTHSFERI